MIGLAPPPWILPLPFTGETSGIVRPHRPKNASFVSPHGEGAKFRKDELRRLASTSQPAQLEPTNDIIDCGRAIAAVKFLAE